ncbi:hypothetical protein [Rhodopirellula europaea]|uniref:hypothetical protein n=1 Tax=Rhodopirellula europaea TaxID=1263866 RepID=UPI003D2A3391|tara:strand:- start:6003 stop:6224 length:222 start_codon:yes stop_codon:yes gene_type:complete
MPPNEISISADGLRMLNAVCDEYRRRLKATLVESAGDAPVLSSDVLKVAAGLQQSWLKQFLEDDSDDLERRAA